MTHSQSTSRRHINAHISRISWTNPMCFSILTGLPSLRCTWDGSAGGRAGGRGQRLSCCWFGSGAREREGDARTDEEHGDERRDALKRDKDVVGDLRDGPDLVPLGVQAEVDGAAEDLARICRRRASARVVRESPRAERGGARGGTHCAKPARSRGRCRAATGRGLRDVTRQAPSAAARQASRRSRRRKRRTHSPRRSLLRRSRRDLRSSRT